MDRTPLSPKARQRIAIAQRVADAHRGIDDASLLSFVSGSTVDNLSDDRSDVDMSVVFARLPDEAILREACRRVGGGSGEWAWSLGALAEGSGVVSFQVDGIEVQIGYSTASVLEAELDQVLIEHDPDTPNQKMAEAIGKAHALAGAESLAALQDRVAAFPPALGRAMVMHGLATPTPWRAATQIIHRDTPLWCREIQVDACYRLLLILCGLNGRYFTRFQVKRVSKLASRLRLAPAALAERIETLLAAPPREAFVALHRLEGEVLDLIADHLPDVDLTTVRQRREAFAPA